MVKVRKTLQNHISSEYESLDKTLRIQKTEYIKQQIERQRAAEDERLEYLLKEQDVIEDLRNAIDDSMWQTEGIRKYNREFQEHINKQVYEAHGITADKLAGMNEYKKALYTGAGAALFLLSLALTVLCGVLYGFQSNICLLMFGYMAIQGMLLSGEERRPSASELVCKVLYMLIFPTMLVMFVCFSLKYRAYELFLPYAAVLGVFVTVAGVIPWFLHDPYRQDKKKMLEAKKHIRDIERAAGKEIRKEQKDGKQVDRSRRRFLKCGADTKKSAPCADGSDSVPQSTENERQAGGDA